MIEKLDEIKDEVVIITRAEFGNMPVKKLAQLYRDGWSMDLKRDIVTFKR